MAKLIERISLAVTAIMSFIAGYVWSLDVAMFMLVFGAVGVVYGMAITYDK